MAYFKLFKELWHYAGSARWKIVLFLTLHALAYGSLVFQPYVFAQILNSLQGPREAILPTVLRWTGVWVGIFVWFNLGHRSAQYFVFSVAYRAKQAFLNDAYACVTKLPLAWHADHHSGDTINRINTAATALANYGMRQFAFVEYFVYFWGPLIALSFLSWKVSLIALTVALVSLFVMSLFDKKLVLLFREINNVQHKVASIFYDYVSNIRTIVTLRLQDQTRASFNHQIELGYPPFIKALAFVDQMKWQSVNLATLLLKAGIVFYYIWMKLGAGGPILAGNVTAVFQYLGNICDTFFNVARDYQQMLSWQTDFESTKPIFAALPAKAATPGARVAWKKASISHLSFHYEPARLVLDDVAFSFAKGEKIAVIGESGSGKSSMMAILRGLYQPDAVKLRLGDQHASTLAPLFDCTTLIPQDPEIFENTLRFNLTFGLDYPEEKIVRAMELARFDRVIARLPKGLETDVREKGVTFSGGEKQRLALARGILAAQESEILLLDEPTSSVDAMNERAIFKNLLKHFTERTVIASLHRLQLLDLFDKILVMDQGRLVQCGTLATLKTEPGPFQAILSGKHTTKEGA